MESGRNCQAESADVLEAAVDILELEGWVQGDLFRVQPDKSLSYCAVGAIRKAASVYQIIVLEDAAMIATDERDFDKRWKAAWSAQQVVENRLDEALTSWNDTLGRTEFEVIDLLKSTAKDIRNRAGEQ